MGNGGLIFKNADAVQVSGPCSKARLGPAQNSPGSCSGIDYLFSHVHKLIASENIWSFR